MTTIDEIKNKYNIPYEHAALIYFAVSRENIPLHIVMSIYNTISKRGNLAQNLKTAIHAYQVTQLHVKRPIGTKDDKSTKQISHKFDQYREVPVLKNGKPVIGDDGKPVTRLQKFRVIEDEDGNKLPVHMTNVSTRRMFTADDYKEKHPSPRDIPPKYYYFDLDLKFNNRGYEKSPQHDPQFKGYYYHVPYARVTTGKVISPSHYPVPITDEAGNIIGREKTRGKRILDIDVFFEGESRNIKVSAPYEHLSEYDMIKGVEIIETIKKMLTTLMSDRIKDIYKQIKKGDVDTNTIFASKSYEHGIKNIMDSDKAMREYYGDEFSSDRKRKSIKPKPKRKPSNKKITVKKKCVCKPTTHKRRVMSIKKKLSIRRKK